MKTFSKQKKVWKIFEFEKVKSHIILSPKKNQMFNYWFEHHFIESMKAMIVSTGQKPLISFYDIVSRKFDKTTHPS